MRRWWVALLPVLAVACGPSAPPKPLPKSSAGDKPAAPPATARGRLAAELAKLADPGAVLEGLSAQSRADLQKMVAALSEPERRELARADGPWPRARPLLHLVAGGDSADAYYELATSGAAGDELVAARQHAGGSGFDDLVDGMRSLVERAAARWLRERTAEISPRVTPAWCDKVDRAAARLGRVVVQRRARELAVELEPSSLRWAAVAHAASWELDLPAARAALTKARAAEPAVVAAIERNLAAAERALGARGKKLGRDDAIAAARANLRLGRHEDALAAIAPHAGELSTHLGVATLTVMAKTPSLVCPGLPRGMPHPLLCAVAWSKDSRVRDAAAVVERAWGSRRGRDEDAIGAYLGIAHFVPWIYGTYLASSAGGDSESAFGQRIERVRVALREAVAASAPFEGVLLFVETLAGLYESGKQRKAGERVRLGDELDKQLQARAAALSKQLPSHRFTQAGTLAVATALSQERDVTPLLERLPSALDPEYLVAAEVLRLWTAVGARDAQRVDAAAGSIASRLSQDTAPTLSAKLILLIAEARSAVLATPREIEVLSRIASQLATPDMPEELRLRAAIDHAGCLSRQGNARAAEAALESVLAQTPSQASSTAADLATVARSYLLVLRARRVQGDERKALRADLAQLGQAGQLPASIVAWQKMWVSEIDRLIAEDKCGTMKVCRDRAAKQPVLDDKQLAARVGSASANVMQNGVLAAGSMHLNFSFSSQEGLVPIVLFEPRLLAVELPPRPVAKQR